MLYICPFCNGSVGSYLETEEELIIHMKKCPANPENKQCPTCEHCMMHENAWGDIWAECEKLGHTWKRQKSMKIDCAEHTPIEDPTTVKWTHHYYNSSDNE